MYTYKVKARIHNPEREAEVEVQQFSSLEEAIEKYGKTTLLGIINDRIIFLARHNAREKMIKELHKGITQ